MPSRSNWDDGTTAVTTAVVTPFLTLGPTRFLSIFDPRSYQVLVKGSTLLNRPFLGTERLFPKPFSAQDPHRPFPFPFSDRSQPFAVLSFQKRDRMQPFSVLSWYGTEPSVPYRTVQSNRENVIYTIYTKCDIYNICSDVPLTLIGMLSGLLLFYCFTTLLLYCFTTACWR